MTAWRLVATHRVQVRDDAGLLWEHDTAPGYRVPRHMVSSRDGATWSIASEEPLSITPSLYCDPVLGGCGAHVSIVAGQVQ